MNEITPAEQSAWQAGVDAGREMERQNAAVAQEPVAWFTEDNLTDKSATTWDMSVANRWRAKGWPVNELYAAPVAAQAQPYSLNLDPAGIRALTADAITGAIAFGHQGVNPPPDSDHWLAPFWEIGRESAANAQQPVSGADGLMDVDDLAQEIRRVDGRHTLGAAALAEALMPFLARHFQPQPSGNASDEPDWLQRLRLEARDLSDNLDRLSRFRDTAGFRMLTDTDRGLMDRQGNQMHALLQTLNQRIHSGAGQHRRSKSHE